jgi:GNAT superfamily N-acetyltransferase
MDASLARPRIATRGDVPALCALIHRSIAESYRGHYAPAAIAFFHDFHDTAAIEARLARGHVLLIEEAGAPVATGTLDGAEILGLFVAPERQGTGLGRSLVGALLEEARARGLTSVHLSMALPSYAFYARLGFAAGEELATILPTGEAIRYRMARLEL